MVARLTYVCWNCRRAARNTPWEIGDEAPRCPQCQGELHRLSHKAEIPPRTDERAWDEMRRIGEGLHDEREARRRPLIVQRIHEIERRMLELQTRPPNADRDRLIAKARADIEWLRSELEK